MLAEYCNKRSSLKQIFLFELLAYCLAKIYYLTYCFINVNKLKARWCLFSFICPIPCFVFWLAFVSIAKADFLFLQCIRLGPVENDHFVYS